jgi:hypothetical protein
MNDNNMTPEAEVSDKDLKTAFDEAVASGTDVAFAFNGIRPSGAMVSMDPTLFLIFAMLHHPEWLNFETEGPKVRSVVFTEEDAAGVEDIAGTVLVTLDLPNKITTYVGAAEKAAVEWQEKDPVIAERFAQLARLFAENNIDSFDVSEEA